MAYVTRNRRLGWTATVQAERPVFKRWVLITRKGFTRRHAEARAERALEKTLRRG